MTGAGGDGPKAVAGRHAATLIEAGMAVGLGTGSTVQHTIVALGEAGLELTCTATSTATAELADGVGLRVVPPDELGRVDIAVDGADEVDPAHNLTKGGGGALTREKVVAEMADRFVVVVDPSKLVDALGPFGTPLEVLDFAPGVVSRRLTDLGAESVSVRGQRSDNGNLLLDAHFGAIDDAPALAGHLAAIPGIVEHGLFLADCVSEVIVGHPDGSVDVRPTPG